MDNNSIINGTALFFISVQRQKRYKKVSQLGFKNYSGYFIFTLIHCPQAAVLCLEFCPNIPLSAGCCPVLGILSQYPTVRRLLFFTWNFVPISHCPQAAVPYWEFCPNIPLSAGCCPLLGILSQYPTVRRLLSLTGNFVPISHCPQAGVLCSEFCPNIPLSAGCCLLALILSQSCHLLLAIWSPLARSVHLQL